MKVVSLADWKQSKKPAKSETRLPLNPDSDDELHCDLDPEFEGTDEEGNRMFCYVAVYIHRGFPCSFNFWAYDLDDALERINSMKQEIEYAGQIMKRVESGE